MGLAVVNAVLQKSLSDQYQSRYKSIPLVNPCNTVPIQAYISVYLQVPMFRDATQSLLLIQELQLNNTLVSMSILGHNFI